MARQRFPLLKVKAWKVRNKQFLFKKVMIIDDRVFTLIGEFDRNKLQFIVKA